MVTILVAKLRSVIGKNPNPRCGMDVKTLSEILGHKNSSVTLNRYAHSMLEHKQDMMNKVGKLL